MDINIPQTTDLEGTIAEFREFFDKRKLYLHPKDIYGTPLNKCDIVQDEPRSFIKLSLDLPTQLRYVGTIFRDGKNGRVELYRVKNTHGYKIKLVKLGQVIDENGNVMSLPELAQHPGYRVNKRV